MAKKPKGVILCTWTSEEEKLVSSCMVSMPKITRFKILSIPDKNMMKTQTFPTQTTIC
jgi:hypothetical protein